MSSTKYIFYFSSDMGKLKIYEMPLGFFKVFSKRNKLKNILVVKLFICLKI